jgi:hypothetical protein
MGESVNRASLIAVFAFSLIALSTLVVALSAALLSTGHLPQPEPDEGTAAHIFQLSIALLMPAGLVFLATANWARPGRVVRALFYRRARWRSRSACSTTSSTSHPPPERQCPKQVTTP